MLLLLKLLILEIIFNKMFYIIILMFIIEYLNYVQTEIKYESILQLLA